MKKTLGILSKVIATIGMILILATIWITTDMILFYIGVLMFIIGTIGVLLFGTNAKQFIMNLLDCI